MGKLPIDTDEKEEAGPGKVFTDFDCPLCNANNPYDDGFRAGDEVRCFYCSAEFRVVVDDSGKLKMKEV